MGFDKHLDRRGVSLQEDNSLPVDQRTQRSVKRIIAAIRAAEAEFNDELRAANERCRFAQEQVIELTHRYHKLEAELRQMKVQERLAEMDAISVADKKKLLEVS